MLTSNQLHMLCPQFEDQLNNNMKIRSKRCLFGSPDPLDTKKLLEEQFMSDRDMMLRKYNFDILTSRPVPSADTVTSERDEGDAVSASLSEEKISESEVRHRTGRHSPYNRQTRITGKQQ